MRVFVTGGSGFLGSHLVASLCRRGHAVRALARSEAAADRVESLGAKAVRGSLGSLDCLRLGMEEVHFVYHCAATTAQWGDASMIWDINVEGTRRVVEAARQAGVRRLVHVSSEAVLADGAPIRHADETVRRTDHPIGIYPATKAAAEELVIDACEAGFETIAVRPRLIWGPGDRTLVPILEQKIRSGVFRWVDGGRYLTSTCHVSNCVEGLMLAAERSRPGEIYFITDGEPTVFREFVTALLATRGVTPPERSAPLWLVRGAAAALELAWTLLPLRTPPPLTRAEVALGGQEVTVDASKARRELGYVGRVNRADALRSLTSTPWAR